MNQDNVMYDVVIYDGTLIDPKSKRSTVANLGILEGKIAIITREELQGIKVIHAKGLIVSPGFIDPHAHGENNIACGKLLAAMGVTTIINGNCGISPTNFKEFMDQYETQGFPVNQVQQVGHTSLRELAGNLDRYQPSTVEQIIFMQDLLEDFFRAGASGLSFGLEYVPGSSIEEVLELAKIAARYGKIVSIHTRSDSYAGLASLKEAIKICEETGASVHISHLTYMFGLGMADKALSMIEEARNNGLDISVDSGLYHAFATEIGSAVFDEGCVEKWGGNYSVIVAGTGKYRGQRLTEDMYREMREKTPHETGIGMVGKEYEVYEVLEKPYVMVGTDAGTLYENHIPGHPQDAGTYPKFFRTMIREQNRLNLVDAINRCTYMVAERFGIKHKGYLEIGVDADLVIFDLSLIQDTANYPCYGATDSRPEGIQYVLVNGEILVEGKTVSDNMPGKIIRMCHRKWQWNS